MGYGWKSGGTRERVMKVEGVVGGDRIRGKEKVMREWERFLCKKFFEKQLVMSG